MTANNSHAQVTRANAHPPGEVSDYIDFAEGAAPGTPASGFVRLYAKTTGVVASKDDAGSETEHGAGGSGVTFAANNPEDIGTMHLASITRADVTVGLANRAFFMPFIPRHDETVTKIRFRVGTQSGNVDAGVYDASLTLLAAAGSTACGAVGMQALTIASTALTAGTLYYIGFACDNITAKFYGSGISGLSAMALTRTNTATTGAFAYLNSGFALPAGPVTPTGVDPQGSLIAAYCGN